MARTYAAPGETLRILWRRLAPLPGGTRLFSWILGRINPYTGALRLQVTALEPGFARAVLRDRRGLRNHLNSVHAVALTNLGEAVSGLAMLAGLPATVRGIPLHISATFLKKARGRLMAECRTPVPAVARDQEVDVTATITDASGETVARVTVRWRLAPVPTVAARA